MPFLSKKQAAWGNSPTGKRALGGAGKVAEWNQSTDFKSLPERKSGALKSRIRKKPYGRDDSELDRSTSGLTA